MEHEELPYPYNSTSVLAAPRVDCEWESTAKKFEILNINNNVLKKSMESVKKDKVENIKEMCLIIKNHGKF